MLTPHYIQGVGRMMFQCGEGPLQTERAEKSPVILGIEETEGSIQIRLVHVLTESGDVGIQNVSDDEYDQLKKDGKLAD